MAEELRWRDFAFFTRGSISDGFRRAGRTDGDGVERGKPKEEFFTEGDPKRRNEGTGDDDLTSTQRLAESSEKIGDVTDDVDEFAG